MARHEGQELIKEEQLDRVLKVYDLLNTVGTILFNNKPKPAINSCEVGIGDDVYGYYARHNTAIHVQADPLRAGEKQLLLMIGSPIPTATMHRQRWQSMLEGTEEKRMREHGEPINLPYSAAAVAGLVLEAFEKAE